MSQNDIIELADLVLVHDHLSEGAFPLSNSYQVMKDTHGVCAKLLGVGVRQRFYSTNFIPDLLQSDVWNPSWSLVILNIYTPQYRTEFTHPYLRPIAGQK